MITKKLFSALILCFALFTTHTQAAPILTDIVFIVDESGSMGGVQANLRNNIGLFASILEGTGQVSARYGLVGYGDSQVRPRMITNFTDPTTFATAAQGLRTNGGTEPGRTATAFALNALDGQSSVFSYRSNAVKNLIIVTDEPSNGDVSFYGTVGGSAVSESILDGLLTSNNALYNGILTSYSDSSYRSLIENHDGSVFNLSEFGSNDPQEVQDFVTAFANTKLQETLDFCQLNPNDPACNPTSVSEPSSFALLALSLAGLAGIRLRKKNAA
jgi:hypothetical protein